ncbi:ATPase [Lysinibacillus endophyticus]|uniref:ATPase n=2 Tax=Ureibacillus endophyticus TaxID=1978490 RepID=A0A494YSD3_9BACL|nr:ATPase [Lysinibacillus endophyticus]
MKTKRLVLLSGLSGIGKSRIVQLYAKALGAESNLNFISVSPSWTDDTDLLGFPDTLNNVYRPGDSGLVNTLIKASNDQDNIYIICFDEMNLARVEHYFSQFLSVLEMEDRKILKLYNSDLEHRFYNSEQYPSQIKIGQNILFVGTVNVDETTYHFSDKVLDRSNVIELEIKEFSELLEFGKQKNIEKLKTIREQIGEFPITATTFNSFSNNDREMALSKSDLELLWEIHKVLQKASKKFGIGTRVVKHIDQYLKNIPEGAPITKEDGIDLQIAQRVLTKLRGVEEVMRELVGNYDEQTKTVTGSLLIEKLDNSNYNFTRSKKMIEQKAKELSHNGFAI